MAQGEFDFVDFNKRVQAQRDKEYAEAKAGRDALRARLEEAETRRCEIEEEIEGLEEQIKIIDQFLGEEESIAPRDSGVKKTLETIAPKIKDWSFDAIIDAVKGYKPRVKPSSVRSALTRLVRDKVLSVNGGRGEKTWTYILKPAAIHTGEAKTETVDLPEGDPDDVTTFPLTGTHCSVCGQPQYQSPSGDICVNGHGGAPSAEMATHTFPAPAPEPASENEILAKVEQRILEAVDKNKSGADSKTLAWIMTDTGATNEQFEKAVKRLVGIGEIEEGKSLDDAGGHVLRRPAEPGSKEELKRTEVQGRMGFPGMDKPPHL